MTDNSEDARSSQLLQQQSEMDDESSWNDDLFATAHQELTTESQSVNSSERQLQTIAGAVGIRADTVNNDEDEHSDTYYTANDAAPTHSSASLVESADATAALSAAATYGVPGAGSDMGLPADVQEALHVEALELAAQEVGVPPIEGNVPLPIYMDAMEIAAVQIVAVDPDDGNESDEEMHDNHSDSSSDYSIYAEAPEVESDEDDHYNEVAEYPGNITFDQSAPAEHRYLGESMEEMSGRMIFDEESVVTLPAMSMHGVTLIPGQTLPLQVFHPRAVAMLRTVAEGNKTFCFINPRGNGMHTADIADIGVTAEVFSISPVDDDENSVKALAKGRQRFRVISLQRQLGGIMMATVEILPELDLGDPLKGASSRLHMRHYALPTRITEIPTSTSSAIINNSSDNQKQQVRLHDQTANVTAWPNFVYKQFSPTELLNRVKEEVRQWGEDSHHTSDCITSPDQLSYWVAENLPFCDEDKLDLLEMNSSIQRLRHELYLLQKCASVCCRTCGRAVAKKSDVFSLSQEGPMGTYVNPHGCVHETLTVYKVKPRSISLFGQPSTEHSWFPGYAWTIANCKTCGRHKGWKFTATLLSLKPQIFYGLSRNGLKPDFEKTSTDSGENSTTGCCCLL